MRIQTENTVADFYNSRILPNSEKQNDIYRRVRREKLIVWRK